MHPNASFRGSRILILAVMLLIAGVASGAAADAFDDTEWHGDFVCGQMSYSFTLSLPASDGGAMRPGAVRFETAEGVGEYSVRGRIDGRNFLFLPDEWVERPAGANAVGFEGSLHENGLLLNGNVRGCPAMSDIHFVAERRATDEPIAFGEVAASPAIETAFTGQWQGDYECSNRERWGSLPVTMTLVQQGTVVGGFMSLAWETPDGPRLSAVIRGEVDESGEVRMARIASLTVRIWLRQPPIVGSLKSGEETFEGAVSLPASLGECRFSVARQGPPEAPNLTEIGLDGVWAGIRTLPYWQPEDDFVFLDRAYQVRLMLGMIDGQPVGAFEAVAPLGAPPVRQDRFQLSVFPIMAPDQEHVILVPLAVLRAGGRFADVDGNLAFMVKIPDGSPQASRLAIQTRYTGPAQFEVEDDFGDLAPQGPQAIAAMIRGEGPAYEFPGGIAGTITEAPSIDAQCRILTAWADPYLRGFEQDEYSDNVNAVSAPMFADEIFEPVFGLPFAFTSKEEREAIRDLGGDVCGPRLGIEGFNGSAFVRMLGPSFMDMVAIRMDRTEAASWIADAESEVRQLTAKPANLMRLMEIEGEATLRRSEIQPDAMESLTTAISDRRAAIDVVAYMAELDEVPSLPETTESLPRLMALSERAGELRLDNDQHGQAQDTIRTHLRNIVSRRLAEIRDGEDSVRPDLDGLAKLTTEARQLDELARRLAPTFQDERIGGAQREIDVRRQQLLADDRVQAAFESAAGDLRPSTMRPSDAVRSWASNYLLENEMERAPGAYGDTVDRTVAQLEVAAINITDRSQGGPAGQPTAEEMALALKRQVDALNASLSARHTNCQAGGFGNDPFAAMECLVILGAGGGERWETFLTHFEKLGCTGGVDGSAYLCDFSAGIASTSELMQGRLGEILSAGSLNRGRFLQTTDGWQYIKQPVVVVR